ncbi:hypothetical protein QFC19_007460 [Naganishia cerealis]|uniref:Uncharacterized protein n=1 Tax=Naganishia cerealis TaxID=610337 RepID=A0ACC2VB05_9TREE|nr:hypothetical protein QFC19_007460 [Naganishia cerealis]
MTQHTHYFPPHNANLTNNGGQLASAGAAGVNTMIASSPGFKVTKITRSSSKKGMLPPVSQSSANRGDKDGVEDMGGHSRSSGGGHSRHHSPSSSIMGDHTSSTNAQHYNTSNSRTIPASHVLAGTPSQMIGRVRSSSGAVAQLSPAVAAGTITTLNPHQYYSAAPSPVRENSVPDVFGPVTVTRHPASSGTMSPAKLCRSDSTKVTASTTTPDGPDDIDPISIGIRSSSPAGPSLDQTSALAKSVSSASTPVSSPHIARGRNRRKSASNSDVDEKVETGRHPDFHTSKQSSRTVRSRIAPAPHFDRRAGSTSPSVQLSPQIRAQSISRPVSPVSRSAQADASERAKTPERNGGTDRDSGVARVRSAASVDTGLNALSTSAYSGGSPSMTSPNSHRKAYSVATGTASVGAGFAGTAGLLVASPRKGKAKDYGDRFIPQRDDSSNLHASYRLIPDGPGSSLGYVVGGVRTESDMSAAAAALERAKRKGANGEIDAMKDRAYSQLLRSEMFGASVSPVPNERPHASSSASMPNVHLRSPSRHATIPFSHYAVHGPGLDALPTLPVNTANIPSNINQGAFATSFSPLRTGQAAYSSGFSNGTPITPSKKRVLNYSSPSAKSQRSSPSRNMNVSPGQFNLGYGNGTNVGMPFDDMLSQKYSQSPIGKESQRGLLSPRKPTRWISKTPFKVLDAPELADDFYLNLVSWSQTNLLAVGLSSCVYLWSAATSQVTRLADLSAIEGRSPDEGDVVTGLDWTNKGSTIAIGTNKGCVEIWDAEKEKKLRTMTGHEARVGSLAWNGSILSTGSRDRKILHRDVRVPEHYIRELKGHRQEVCGLKWNTQTDQLASGGNDNKLYIWEKTNDQPLFRFPEHTAAVKAIAWSPHQRGLLASGGGTADRKIRYWNTLTGNLLSEWDTGSQVCNLMWSKNSNEIVSTHGYSGGPVSNQITVWKYPSMSQVATLTGHTYRVLYLAMGPDGQTIVTGAGDETLRFWNAFQTRKSGDSAGVGTGEGFAGAGEKRRDDSSLNPFSKIR